MRIPPGNDVTAKMMPSGAGAAAVLSAGIGVFVLGIISVLADKLRPLAAALNFYHPTGPLSGVRRSRFWRGLARGRCFIIDGTAAM